MYLNLTLLAVFLACFAMHVREGLWNNALSFFNVMTAGLLATNYFEPAATFMTLKMPSYTYLWDFLCLWGIFCVVLIILRLITDRVSQVKVRFRLPVDWAGGIFFGLWVSWIMVCFVTFSLHLAPLAQSPFGGAFLAEPTDSTFFAFSPDRQWLAFVHTLSLDGTGPDGAQGSLSRGRGENEPPEYNVFDPQGEFVLKYGASRKKFEENKEIRTTGSR